MDLVIYLSLIGAFALLAAAHLTLAVGLMFRDRAWRGWVVLLPPAAPLAVYWGFREGMTLRGLLWVASGATYGVALVAAHWSSG